MGTLGRLTTQVSAAGTTLLVFLKPELGSKANNECTQTKQGMT